MSELEDILHSINPEGFSTLEECEDILKQFFHNFAVILKTILTEGSVRTGYNKNSPIFAPEPISDGNFTRNLEITSQQYLTEDIFLNWPDSKTKGPLLRTLFTYYRTNNKFYSSFIKRLKEKKDEWAIESMFQETNFLNYRTSILNLEKAIIMTINRNNLSKIEKDLRETLQNQAENAASENKALEAFWNTLINEDEGDGDLKEEYATELTGMVYTILNWLQESAKTYNILKTVVPSDITADKKRFIFSNYNDYMTAIPNILIHLQTICSKIESRTFGGKKIKFDEQEKYKQAVEDLKLGNNFKFQIQTTIPDTDLKLTPVESTNLKVTSPRSDSPKPMIKITKEEKTDSNIDLDSDSDDDTVPSVKTKDKNSEKFSMALRNVKKTQSRVDSALQDDLKKSRCQNLLGELKQVTEMARNVLFKETTNDKEITRKLEDAIDQYLVLMDSLTEILDGINSNEVLRQSLPKAAFPTWYGDGEGYLCFKNTMLPHLECLSTEPLKLSTLKHQMVGSNCERLKRKLYGVTTLKKFLIELDKLYGDIEKVLPKKMEQLKQLKSHPKSRIQELCNAEKLLSYCRMCESYNAIQNVNLLWVTQHANLLCEENACRLLQTKGNSEEIIKLLEKITEEDESYNDIQPRVDSKDKSKSFPNWKNNILRRGGNLALECWICSGAHTVKNCPTINSKKNIKDKTQELQRRGICFRCLYKWNPGHTCRQEDRKFICSEHNTNYAICQCQKYPARNNQISDGTVQSNDLKINNSQGESTSLITEVIYLVDKFGTTKKVLCLYDTGNSNTGINNKTADELYGYQKTTNTVNIENFLTGLHKVACNRRIIMIKTKEGTEVIPVFGINGLQQFYEKKSFEIPEKWIKEFNLVENPTTPSGYSTMVIGMDLPHLLPESLNRIHNGVVLYRSKITGKLLIAGRVREQNKVTSNRMMFQPPQFTPDEIYKNISTDSIETSRILKCMKCRLLTDKCVECKKTNIPIPQQQLDYQEAVKKNLTFDATEKKYTASYLYNSNLDQLPVNEEACLRMMQNLERKIEANGLTLAVNSQLEKFRKKGVLMLDTEDVLDPKLPKSHIVMCYSLASNVHKNTQVRLCMNSSFRSNDKTPSLNDCMLDCPSYLNNMEGILVRWRTYQYVAYADISSAYHQISSCPADRSLRRIFIKPNGFGRDNKEEWKSCHLTCLQFGDKLAGAYCAQAISDTVERNCTPENASMMKRNILMDDIILGSESKEELVDTVGDINNGLEAGSLPVKSWSYSGEPSDLTKLLSYVYDTEKDEFSVRTNFNYTKIRRGARSGPPIEKIETIEEYFNAYPITRRTLSSITAGTVHDPLGVVGPYSNNFKFVFSKLAKQQTGWDDKVNEEIKNEVIRSIKCMFNIDKFKFKRQVIFMTADELEIQMFFDGSLLGVAVATVVKNIFKGRPPIIRLLKTKSKVNSKDVNTAPRSELMAALISARTFDCLKYELAEFIEKFKPKPIRIKFIGDSTIVLGQLKKSAYLYKLWASSRILEIQELCSNIEDLTVEFCHCSSQDNMADILTRPYYTENYLPWMKDLPDVKLSTPPEIKDDSQLPEVNMKNLKINSMNFQPDTVEIGQIVFYNNYMAANLHDPEAENNLFDKVIERVSRWEIYRNIVTRCLLWKYGGKKDLLDIQADAENLIFRHFQSKMKNYLSSFQGDIYYKEIVEGVTVLKGRNTPAGQTIMKIVPPKTKLYNLITKSFHMTHMSPNHIQTQLIKAGYYCPGVVKRLKKLQRECPYCRKKMMITKPTEMGMQREKRLIPSKPFKTCQMDLAGPFLVKDFVNKRSSTRKLYLLITICDYTRMISIVPVEDLGKQALMNAMSTHFNRFGYASRIESDFGTNFVSLKSEVKNSEDQLRVLTVELQSLGVELVQRSPRASWLQGSAEHGVKMVKKAMKTYKSPLTAFGWLCLIEKTMRIVNSRPIGVRSTGEVLTPNDLNICHSNIHGTITVDQNDGNIAAYKDLVDRMEEDFKKMWFDLYHRTVLGQKKWIEKTECLEIGDLVLIVDHKNKNNYPTLGKITFIKPDSTGVSRYFSVTYKLEDSKLIKTLVRTQKSLVLIMKEKENRDLDMENPNNNNNEDTDKENTSLKIVVPNDSNIPQIKDGM